MNVRDVTYFKELVEFMDKFKSYSLILEVRDVPFAYDYNKFLRVYVNHKYVLEVNAQYPETSLSDVKRRIENKVASWDY